MTLPPTIRIGLYEYAVSEVPELRNGEKGVWGLISHQRHTIEIEGDTPLRHKQYLLWHEMLHSMLAQAGLHGIDLEEPIVIALGHAIVGMLRNNPDVITFTLEDKEVAAVTEE